MRSSEVWTRSACDVSVPDAGLGQRQSLRQEPEAGHSTAPRRGSLAIRAMRCCFLGSGIGDRAAILGVFKPVRLGFYTYKASQFALCGSSEQLCEIWFENYTVCGEHIVLVLSFSIRER